MTNTPTHSLETFRRHSRKCAGTGLCHCIIWIRGRASADSEYVRHSLETGDVSVANRMMQDLLRGIDPRTKASFSVRDAVATWIADQVRHRDNTLATSTITSYEYVTRKLVEAIGDLPISAVNAHTIRNYRDTHREHLAAGTWLLELTILRMFFTWCGSSPQNWISIDPTEGVPRPAKPHLRTPPLNDNEVTGIIEACDQLADSNLGFNPNQTYAQQRARALVSLLLRSGLRISDAAALKRAALNPETGHLTLRTVKSQGRSSIKVQLPPETVKLLLALPASNAEYFFWSGESDLSTICRVLRRVIVRLGEIAGIENLHPHRFRDTFAVALLSEGTDIRQVQQLLGHSSVVVTEKHYAHFIDRHQDLLDAATSRLRFGQARTPVLLKPVPRRLAAKA